MRLFTHLIAASTLAAAIFSPVSADVRADVQVFDRHTGYELPVYFHEGRRYVVGRPGLEYEFRIRNRGPNRLLAVSSVDGVNVISGQTADLNQAGYVIPSYAEVRVEGWRKSLSQAAGFYFAALPDSYAARTGRSADVGVIGVALFREKASNRRCCRWFDKKQEFNDQPSGAPTESEAGRGDLGSGAAHGKVAPESTRRVQEQLGTGHGRRMDSMARRVEFERDASQPDEIIAIYYDSRLNLMAQGVIPRRQHYAPHDRPRPFPTAGFAPDP